MTPFEALRRDNLKDAKAILEDTLKTLNKAKEELKEKLLEINELDEEIVKELSNSSRALNKIKILLDSK